jgi:protease I
MNIETRGLRGKRVGILAGDGFEYVELAIPKMALAAAGATVEVISLHHGRIRGMNLTEPTRTVKVDRHVQEVGPEDYDALFIPGGFIGPDFVRQSSAAREFVRAFDQTGKPIATLCHGPWVLVSAELVEGRQLSSWPGIRDDIVHAGGIWRNEPLVQDGNWVSCRGPQDLKTFIPAMTRLFALGATGEPRGAEIPSHNRQSSPQPREPIPLALAAARLLPGPTLRTVAAAAALVAVTGAVLRRTNRQPSRKLARKDALRLPAPAGETGREAYRSETRLDSQWPG